MDEDLFSTDDEIANRALAMKLAALRREQSMNTLGMISGDAPLAMAGKVNAGNTGDMQKFVTATPSTRQKLGLERRQTDETARHYGAVEANTARGLDLEAKRQAQAAAQHAAMLKHQQDVLAADSWQGVAPTATHPGYLYNKKTSEVKPLPDGFGGGGGAGAPFDITKLTAEQAKAYAAANRILDNYGVVDTGGPTGMKGRKDLAATGMGGGGPASWFIPQEAASEGGRLYFDAAKNVIGGLLRKESGAAITADEWNTLGPNYVPMPWDTEETRNAKLQRLRSTLNVMIAEAGPQGAAKVRARAQELYGTAILSEQGAVPPGSAAGVTPPGSAPPPGAAPASPQGLNYGKFGYRKMPGGQP